jgi:predicted RNase H-like nuclease (RuvC/YqgF family)
MSFQPELEPYKEVIDIMAARIKRAEQHNTYLREAVAECQKRIERLNAELENVAWTSSPALAQAQIDQLVARNAELERDKARLDWLLLNPITFQPVQIPCPDGKAGVPGLPLPTSNTG